MAAESDHPRASREHIEAFVTRWKASGAAERANCQLFLAELCDILHTTRPEPTTPHDEANAYVFERSVTFNNGDGTTSPGRIDLYKRGCFVLEAKQGADKGDGVGVLSTAGKANLAKRRKGTATRDTAGWEMAMMMAKGQAENYVRALPASEGRPPFIVVVDVGHCIELYSEFTRTGGAYVPFPDPRSHRILMDDLTKEEVLAQLRLLWTEPMALDPSRRSAKVTREIADRLARLAQSLERSGHDPERVAGFLMRCLFTMFAEDVGLLPKRAFSELLKKLREQPEAFQPAVEDLWRVMNTGGFHSGFMAKLLRFNGGLFADPHALDITRDQLDLLIEAASADWRDVEPAIFGTLLERALSPDERHKLGAHYTPRAYVERLVLPTIVEPLREEWMATQAAALTLANQDKAKEAQAEIHAFHQRLCKVRILDPACGSGNFLYVCLEHLKRLEGEVFNTLADLGEKQTLIESEGITVDPHQLLGIEINPRAARITELVLWIGYLQWHHRTHGDVNPPEPVIKNFHNIECRDAVLAYDEERIVLDPETKEPLTRWDGKTFKKHPVTGKDVPDESARANVYEYTNPRPAEWPQADFVVGNPPFIGVRRMKDALGEDYVTMLRQTYPEISDTADLVMYWWHKAAEYAEKDELTRFGLITTNSIVQDYSRKVLEMHLDHNDKLSLLLAIKDHPWVAADDGAAVRISMTVATSSRRFSEPAFLGVVKEGTDSVSYHPVPRISSHLAVATIAARPKPLAANAGMCYQGVVPAGDGFKISPEDLEELSLNRTQLPAVVRPYIIGNDITARAKTRFIIDLFGLDESCVRNNYPELYQWLLVRVFPTRKENRRKSYAEKWWIFAEPRPAMRKGLAGLSRFIVTPYTAKHRPFVFVEGETMPDAMAYAIASDDAHLLGVLSSAVHTLFARHSGGTLEDRPRYNSNQTFFPFPFPDATDSQKERIRELGEALDGHRKRQQAQHPDLTMTGMYNVLEKLRSGEALTAKEQTIHTQGLVSVLKEIHDDLDRAVFDAYGWPPDLDDAAILERLVALNAERAAEERQGKIRWLRPEYQCPAGTATQTTTVEAASVAAVEAQAPTKRPWPKGLAEQAQSVRGALDAFNGPATAEQVARSFKSARTERVVELLDTLVSLGQCRALEDGRYVA